MNKSIKHLAISDVVKIRKSNESLKALAQEFGRSERQIRRIKNKDSWKYIVGV